MAFPVEGESLGRSFSPLFGRSVLFLGLGNLSRIILGTNGHIPTLHNVADTHPFGPGLRKQ